ncbi:MAG: type II toxin-antitoxin system VapC family toxin [Actinomycetota bacterium]
MAAVVLDTTVVIDVLRGRPAAVAALEQLAAHGDDPHVCAITVEEATAGLRPRELERATAFFRGVAIAPLGMPEGRLAGFWRRSYRKRGRTLAQADCLIAAAAVGRSARLATGNPKDFPMPDVQVEHWPVNA